MSSKSYRVALIKWPYEAGIGEAIFETLRELGHHPSYLEPDAGMDDPVDVLFLYGPFGKYLSLLQKVEQLPVGRRPTVVFWNTEGLPDLNLPWPLMHTLGAWRSWIGRLSASSQRWVQTVAKYPPLTVLDGHLTRFRYLGDCFYAYQKGWIDVFADISAVYARFFTAHGLPAIHAPFGGFSDWYADLALERDIDVVWMGSHATRRRSQLLDQIRTELQRHGVDIYMVDNVEHPFVYDEERTELLNRTKITLNLLRTWYDENSLRICMAAPNRSLVISEPLLPHVPCYEVGGHYVSAPPAKLAKTILYYLEHEDERQRLANKAYQLLTTRLTMNKSLKTIMDAVVQDKANKVITQ